MEWVGGEDMTPRGWNHLKIIYSHVWCLDCDDSKARTADYSTHTRLDMWHDFLKHDSLSLLTCAWLRAPNVSVLFSNKNAPFYSLTSEAILHPFHAPLLY